MYSAIVLDEKDRVIISMLLKNARVPITEIARKLGITDVAVKKRLEKLEKEGVILEYTIKVNPSKLGYESIAVVGLDVEPEHLLKAIDEIKGREYVKYLALTTGDHMLIAEIWAKNNNDLISKLNEISNIAGIKNVRPAIVLEILKS